MRWGGEQQRAPRSGPALSFFFLPPPLFLPFSLSLDGTRPPIGDVSDQCSHYSCCAHTQSRARTHTHTRPDVGDKWGRDVLWLGQSGSKCKCVRWNMPANGRTISQAAERTDSLASGTITSGDLGLSQLLSLSLSTFPSFPFPPLLPLAPSSFRWAEAKRR